MASRRPLVLVNGVARELPAADTLAGVSAAPLPIVRQTTNTAIALNTEYHCVGSIILVLPASIPQSSVSIIRALDGTVTLLRNGNTLKCQDVIIPDDVYILPGETYRFAANTANQYEVT